MREELLAKARQGVELAQAAGADEAVVRVGSERSLEYEWRDGRLEKVQEDGSHSLSAALYVDGRFSTHRTNDLEPERLRRFLSEAVALTRCLEPDPHRRITDPALYAGRADVDLELVDPEWEGLGREDRVDLCRRIEEHARAHPDVVSATTGTLDGHAAGARVSSNGFEGAVERTWLWYGALVTAREGETKRPEAARWVGGIHVRDVPSPESAGDEALRRVLASRGATKVPSTRTRMVVDRGAGSALVGRMVGALTAGAIQQDQSFLADKLGQRIASDVLTLTDDPLRRRGLASRLYDAEGIASRPRTIVERGVLRTFFVDTYYGSKLGWEPTTGSPSNLVLELGDADRDALLAEVGEGIYVDSWLGGNANPTTGDFSFGLRGHVVRGGELAEPVSEMNVTGNYLDLFERLVRVGNDPEPWATLRTPTLVFDDVQFSGR